MNRKKKKKKKKKKTCSFLIADCDIFIDFLVLEEQLKMPGQ